MLQVFRKIRNWFESDPIIIHLYYAYRFHDKVYVKGRVLQDKRVINYAHDGLVTSFKKMVKRLLTDELRAFRVYIEIGAYRVQSITDDEGYFAEEIENQEGPGVRITGMDATAVSVKILHISAASAYAVISDIDDTIMKTGVTSWLKWRLLINTFFLNPWRRKSYELSSELFHLFRQGQGFNENPVFYISNSPWNMFSYLRQYLKVNGFPKGTLILRDISYSWFKARQIITMHKYSEIESLFTRLTDMNFILIGDAGELDADIYIQIACKYPDRVMAIYIRDLGVVRRSRRISELIDSNPKQNIVLFSHSNELQEHARLQEYILSDA